MAHKTHLGPPSHHGLAAHHKLRHTAHHMHAHAQHHHRSGGPASVSIKGIHTPVKDRVMGGGR
jgi:hypothetical protein